MNVISNDFTDTFLSIFKTLLTTFVDFWNMLNYSFFTISLTRFTDFIIGILDRFNINIDLSFLPTEIDISFLTIITTLLIFALFMKLISLLIPN